MRTQQPYQQAIWCISQLRESSSKWIKLAIDCLGDEVERESELEAASRSGVVLDGGIDLLLLGASIQSLWMGRISDMSRILRHFSFSNLIRCQ